MHIQLQCIRLGPEGAHRHRQSVKLHRPATVLACSCSCVSWAHDADGRRTGGREGSSDTTTTREWRHRRLFRRQRTVAGSHDRWCVRPKHQRWWRVRLCELQLPWPPAPGHLPTLHWPSPGAACVRAPGSRTRHRRRTAGRRQRRGVTPGPPRRSSSSASAAPSLGQARECRPCAPSSTPLPRVVAQLGAVQWRARRSVWREETQAWFPCRSGASATGTRHALRRL